MLSYVLKPPLTRVAQWFIPYMLTSVWAEFGVPAIIFSSVQARVDQAPITVIIRARCFLCMADWAPYYA